MQEHKAQIIYRIKNGESQSHIESEAKRLNEQGIAVMYFNSQASYDEWLSRYQALAQ